MALSLLANVIMYEKLYIWHLAEEIFYIRNHNTSFLITMMTCTYVLMLCIYIKTVNI